MCDPLYLGPVEECKQTLQTLDIDFVTVGLYIYLMSEVIVGVVELTDGTSAAGWFKHFCNLFQHFTLTV